MAVHRLATNRKFGLLATARRKRTSANPRPSAATGNAGSLLRRDPGGLAQPWSAAQKIIHTVGKAES